MKRVRGILVSLLGLSLGFATGALIFPWFNAETETRPAGWAPPTNSGSKAGPGQLAGQSHPTLGPSIPPDRRAVAKDWNRSLGAMPRLVDVTQSAGISFEQVNGLTGRHYYLEIMGSGVGLFDYDGDGFLDIYFVNGNYFKNPHHAAEPSPDITNRLYRNNRDGTFTDVTSAAGVGDPGFGHGCCTGDYDGDGDGDLYVSNFGPNVLYRNNGDGTFTDVTSAAGVEDPAWGQSSAWLDYDGDGRLDLYVQNYLDYSIEDDRGSFFVIADEKVPDYPSPGSFPGSPDRLYRNNGDGTFTDVAEQAGLFYPEGKGMGCACLDFDDDGRLDLFVANDGMENYLFRGRGGGTFEEDGLVAGVAFDGSGIPEGSMGVDVGDFDGDGRIDLAVPCLRVQVYTLYRNCGDYFADVSLKSGMAQATSDRTGFNVNFLDFDNDGDLDLLFITGGVRANELAPTDAPFQTRYAIEDLLLANDGRGHFTDVSSFAGAHFRRRLIGRGSAIGDLDNDGDLDLVINNLAGPAVVLRNDTRSGHWITLSLVARGGHPDALGTSVEVEAGGRKQRSVVHSRVSFLSQSDRRVHFGLGDATRIDRLEVVWPDRQRQVLEDLPVDRFLTIEQGKEVENLR